MSNYYFRASQLKDRQQIADLYTLSFGNSNGLVEDIEGVYRVAICDDAIVAVTGILPVGESYYNGYEVAYSATHPNHRGKGLITKMLVDLIDQLPDDHIPVFASFWKPEADINMRYAADKLGFKLIQEERIRYAHPVYQECNGCPYAHDGCFCTEDLYVLER